MLIRLIKLHSYTNLHHFTKNRYALDDGIKLNEFTAFYYEGVITFIDVACEAI